ncbi:MAG TPA: SAM-dependent chlorinase/fluorinase, partial [Dehalococcoidia bacterium]
AVLLKTVPEARIIDITHEVAPQDTLEAAFIIETSWRWFPAGSIHLVVVDPGVGTSRRRLAIAAGGQWFIGPDNGVLSVALPDASRGIRGPASQYRAAPVALPQGIEAVEIDTGVMSLSRPTSATFEGRDVFAPAAAVIANGAEYAALGRSVDTMIAFQRLRAPSDAGEVYGRVIRVDHFGNLITDVRAEDAIPGSRIRIGDRELPLARTYGDADRPSGIIGSAGYLEIAVPNGSAATTLGAVKGAPVVCVTHFPSR